MVKKLFASIMVIFFCVSIAAAADQTRQKDQFKDQKKDGSCKIIQIDNGQNQRLAADQIRDRNPIKDRKKDGSCDAILNADEGIVVSGDQIRKKDQTKDHKNDGSCQS